VQAVFRLAAQLDKQVIHFNTDTMRYEPLEPPQALDPAQLAMLLPAAVAMQACMNLLTDHTQGQCLIHEMLRPNQPSLVLKTSRLPISIGPASDPGESVTSVLPQALDPSQLAMLLLAAVDMHACMHPSTPTFICIYRSLQVIASSAVAINVWYVPPFAPRGVKHPISRCAWKRC